MPLFLLGAFSAGVFWLGGRVDDFFDKGKTSQSTIDITKIALTVTAASVAVIAAKKALK